MQLNLLLTFTVLWAAVVKAENTQDYKYQTELIVINRSQVERVVNQVSDKATIRGSPTAPITFVLSVNDHITIRRIITTGRAANIY